MVLYGEAQKHSFETKNLNKNKKKQKIRKKESVWKIDFLTEFLNDSAWFCVEKLKKHGFETPNRNI